MTAQAMLLPTYSRAVDAGVDIVDVAYSAFAGGTSQPSMSTLYYALSGKDRQPISTSMPWKKCPATGQQFVRTTKGVDKAEAYPNTKSTSMKCRAVSSPTSVSRRRLQALATTGMKLKRCTIQSA